MVMMKVKRPYGRAKQKVFFFPVRHPRQATRRPKIPITMFPIPIPLAAPSIPLIAKALFYAAVIGILPIWITPKTIARSAMSPIRKETPMTIFEHVCLYLSLYITICNFLFFKIN